MYTILMKYSRKNAENALDEVKKYLDKKLDDAITAIMTEDAQVDLLWRPSTKDEFPWMVTPQEALVSDEKPGSATEN